jgi:uncharacterized OsmC-like protein
MFKEILKTTYVFSQFKGFKGPAGSFSAGLNVKYPHENDKTHHMEDPLGTYISTLSASQSQTLRNLASKGHVKVGNISFSKIQRNYDFDALLNLSGRTNKLSNITLEAEIETNTSDEQLQMLKEKTERICPVYRVISGSGVRINTIWRNKEFIPK